MSARKVKPTKKASIEVSTSPDSQPDIGAPPARNKSAFILFSTQMRKKIKAESKTELNSNEMMILLAEKWKTLDPKEKIVFETEAEQDKLRYQRELKAYEDNLGCKFIKNKTKNNHIKKPCSSYGIFLRENKEAVRQRNPDKKMADILKIISQEWKAIDKVSKKKYEDMAQEDKIRVNAERNGTVPAKPEKKSRKKATKIEYEEPEKFQCKREADRSESYVGEDYEEMSSKHVKVENESNFDMIDLKNLTAAGSVVESHTTGYVVDSMAHLLDSVDFTHFAQHDVNADIANKMHQNSLENIHENRYIAVSKRTTDLIVDLINFDIKQEDNSNGNYHNLYKLEAHESYNTEKQDCDYINYKNVAFGDGLLSESNRHLLHSYDNLVMEGQNFSLDWM